MDRKLLQGNQAIVLGAIEAGVNFFAGYPITPASDIIHEFVERREVKTVQMEDEIASINAVIGASLAGAKAMTATSGPGFSLMQESIGLAHMMEVPLVIVNVQRVGPSTGMPTKPAHGDIMQTQYGSHGDYFPIVFYPNSVDELYRYTVSAFNAAEESLSPVILLSDAYVSHLYETISVNKKFEIVERLRPPMGSSNRHFTGLSHKGSVPTTANTEVYRRLIQHFRLKQREVSARYNFYEYIENPNSDTLLILYGALSRAASLLKEYVSIYRPIRMFPVVEEIKDIAAKYKNIIVMEMNTGQYLKEIESALHRKVEFAPILGGNVDLYEIEEILKKRLLGFKIKNDKW